MPGLYLSLLHLPIRATVSNKMTSVESCIALLHVHYVCLQVLKFKELSQCLVFVVMSPIDNMYVDVDVMMSGLVPFLLCPPFTRALCGAVKA